MDDASVDTLQVVLWFIDISSIPICLVCGTFGNIVSFLVYVKKWSNFTIPLVFLSCFDLLLLWIDGVFSGSWAYFGQAMEKRSYGCAISAYLHISLFLASIFIVTMFTILRTFALVRPHKFAPIFTAKRVVYIALALTLVAFGMECHYIFGISNIPYYNETLPYRYMLCGFSSDSFSTFYFNYWVLVEAIVTLACLGIIVVGNTIVIISLYRRNLTSNTVDASEISRRLITVSIAQVLMWTPWIVLSVIGTGFERDIGSTEDRLLCVLIDLALIPLRIQSGFGFLLYTFIGSEFRAEFLKTIRCCKTGEI